jgi:SAM-dependent methyltransferase
LLDASQNYVWSATDSYEAFVGKWSRLLAQAFLARFVAPTAGQWVDVGCGTGALTAQVLAMADPRAIVGIDPSAAFLATAQATIVDPRARFELGDARALPLVSDAYDAVVSGLVLNFVPEPKLAVAEMVRAACPGGMVGAYVWDFRGEMQGARYFWEAVTVTDPASASLDPRPHFHSCEPEPLADLFGAAKLGDVAVEAIDLPKAFRDFDDFWLPHTMAGAAVAQRYVSALDGEQQAVLRERLRRTLPFAADGSLQLIDRAWMVRGTKRSA